MDGAKAWRDGVLSPIFYTYTLPKWIFYNISFCVGGRFGKDEAYKEWSLAKKSTKTFIDFPLVQILVVVASIQMRNLKTEVEKGFMRRWIRHE